jgi:hypothetical protein
MPRTLLSRAVRAERFVRRWRDLGRTARLAAAGVAATLGAGLLASQAVAAVVGAASSTSTDPVTLADDDGAMAMFTATNVGGGDVMSRCLQVTYDSSGPANLRMYAALTAAGLAPYLHLVVETGFGGSYGDCSGFGGSVLYSGSLAGFAGTHTDFASGLKVPVAPSATPISFRFTVQVGSQAAAQGRTAAADFWWEAQTVDAVATPPSAAPGATPSGPSAPTPPAQPTTPSPALTPSPTGSPIDGAGVPSDPAATSSGAPVTAVTSPSPSGRALPAKPIAVRVHTSPDGETQQARGSGGLSLVAPAHPANSRDASRRHNRAQVLPLWLDRAATLAAVAGKRTGFPILMLLLAFLFLVMQDRIDRREPKLALAPVHAEPDLPFEIPEEQS